MVKPIIEIAKTFVNLIYPLHCASCKKGLEPLDKNCVCTHCASLIRPNPYPYCTRCGRAVDLKGGVCEECKGASFSFESARSACLYEGVMKELIHTFKYASGGLRLGNFLSNIMNNSIRSYPGFTEGVEIVTFVPLYNNRLRERGFNQSKVLAAGISRELEIPVMDCLDKIKNTKHQSELDRSDRLSNLTGAFRVRDPQDITGKIILLIDDVMTTGSTLNECARVLLDDGAKEVRCFTLARGL